MGEACATDSSSTTGVELSLPRNTPIGIIDVEFTCNTHSLRSLPISRSPTLGPYNNYEIGVVVGTDALAAEATESEAVEVPGGAAPSPACLHVGEFSPYTCVVTTNLRPSGPRLSLIASGKPRYVLYLRSCKEVYANGITHMCRRQMGRSSWRFASVDL